MKLDTFYMTICVTPEGVTTSGPLDWREACDDLAECQALGRECVVWRVDPPFDGRAGSNWPVTALAEVQVRDALRRWRHDQ